MDIWLCFIVAAIICMVWGLYYRRSGTFGLMAASIMFAVSSAFALGGTAYIVMEMLV
jgi:membrane protease YdiL (CAAX protease family)